MCSCQHSIWGDEGATANMTVVGIQEGNKIRISVGRIDILAIDDPSRQIVWSFVKIPSTPHSQASSKRAIYQRLLWRSWFVVFVASNAETPCLCLRVVFHCSCREELATRNQSERRNYENPEAHHSNQLSTRIPCSRCEHRAWFVGPDEGRWKVSVLTSLFGVLVDVLLRCFVA